MHVGTFVGMEDPDEKDRKDRVGYWTKERRTAFGARLKAARNARGLSLAGVAKDFESTRARVGHWETGERLPDLAALVQLCEMLRISADRLLLGTEQWPFRSIDYEKVTTLQREDKRALEGAIIGAASSLGLNIARPPTEAQADPVIAAGSPTPAQRVKKEHKGTPPLGGAKQVSEADGLKFKDRRDAKPPAKKRPKGPSE